MSFSKDPLSLVVEQFDAKGRPISHFSKADGQPAIEVELPYGVPGDRLKVELGRVRRHKARARVLQIEEASKDRVLPRCPHTEMCGGCGWQALDYAAQLSFKQETIEKKFTGFLASGTELKPIIPCHDPWRYRNKMEFSFSQDSAGTKYLGLLMSAGKGRVVNLQECHLCEEWMMEALALTRSWWEGIEARAYHPYRDTGALRTLTLRDAKRTQDKMAILTVSGRSEYALTRKELDLWVKVLTDQFPGISCFLRIQQACKGLPTQFYEWHLAGKDHLEEILRLTVAGEKVERKLRLSPSSFFQPNTYQAERLYSEALHLLGNAQEEHIIDLYAGTATIGMALSPLAKQVTSIELNPYAILDAQENLRLNQITNVELIQADAGEALMALAARPGFQFPSILVVDPPRSGLGPKALEPILALKPSTLLYISCNPTTQAADVEIISKNGYRLELLQPLDQFPHTPHLENIALLRLLLEPN